jgi:hypothetical protein
LPSRDSRAPAGKQRGYIVAFSFTRGAREEAAAAKARKGLEIKLAEVSDLLEHVPDLVTPTPEAQQMYLDLLPRARPREARPTAEELVESDQRAAAVG